MNAAFEMNEFERVKPASNAHIPASIEISPKQALDRARMRNLFPAGTRVYLTDVSSDPADLLVRAACVVGECGYIPVSHVAARRIPDLRTLEDRIKALSHDAGVREVLVVGGGVQEPAGEFTCAMDVLESGVLDRNGIVHVAVAGHPEGSPDFSEEVAVEALRLKKEYGERTGADLKIVTQFGFDGDKFVNWAKSLENIGLPIHLGVAGPAKVTTLMKYAAICGVGNSIEFLKKHTRSLTTLAFGHSPEDVVAPIERAWRDNLASSIQQIHVFPFGGLQNSVNWLRERGSWKVDQGGDEQPNENPR